MLRANCHSGRELGLCDRLFLLRGKFLRRDCAKKKQALDLIQHAQAATDIVAIQRAFALAKSAARI